MQKISKAELKNFVVDKMGRRRFLRRAFRFGGIGGLVFAAVILIVVFNGIKIPQEFVIALLVLGISGFVLEYALNLRARKTIVSCSNCSHQMDKYLNSDRPNDTEYLYVCHKCRLYFSVLYSEEPTSYT